MRYELIHDEATEALLRMEKGSVHCCVTSPPYFAMRSYLDASDPRKSLEIGSETFLEDYVTSLSEVFSAMHSVLRDDGTFWLNLGDTMVDGSVGCVPWRVAMRLVEDGWFLRTAAPWIKKSPMPESATNRPSNGLEYVFMFTKKKSGYFYDADAVRKPVAATTLARDKYTRITAGKDGPYAVQHDHETPSNPKGRNRRNTDWWVESLDDEIVGFHLANKSFKGAHFAVMPESLVRPCILAGCPDGGTVIDPFCGSGTTLVVANAIGRAGIGIDLNGEYIEIAKERLNGTAVAL
jgi:site-specific DNA-methyltransferase (adenine-specific)